MNWPSNYSDRLATWVALRERSRLLPLPDCLLAVNQWWQKSPWQPYYLHWNDRNQWPDPWQLLADNCFCDVARALGMLYTVYLLDRADCQDARMVQTDQGNLVLIQDTKYIMNWLPDRIVNIPSQEFNIQHVLEPTVLASITR